jgi:acyl-lipid omega-6 desaturase (Delta-12 desaturase)
MSTVMERSVERTSRADVEQYVRSDLGRSLRSLATSVLPFLALWLLMFAVYPVSYWLVLVLAVPAAGFLVRTYIMFHDCVHGSLLSSKRANTWLGSALGLLVFTPFGRWRYEHLVHHATASDLDRRFVGDVPMLTVDEYRAKPLYFRIGYRFYRNPFVMFGLGSIYSTIIMQRFQNHLARNRMRRSIWGTNVALVVMVATLCFAFGWQAVIFVELPIVILAGGFGIWLFYVQHQFDDTYWERTEAWDYTDAALRGSSHLALPRVLQFFSGNIGFHHVHHLNPKIPNYRLQQAHEEQASFRAVPSLSTTDALRATRLKLWDENGQRMVTWKQARAST